MRLLGGIFNYSQPLCLCTGKKRIYRSSDSHLVEIYLRTDKPVSRKVNDTVLYISLCTKRLKALDMLVNRSAAKVTPTRERHARLLESAEQRT